MTKPPQDPGSGPRIRARARGGSSAIRPEVADALGGVERSLSEVARWEQMLAGRAEGGPVIPALPEGYVGLATDELAPPVEEVPAEAPEEVPAEVADEQPPGTEGVPIVREIGLLGAAEAKAAAEGDDEADEPRDAAAQADALVAPLLADLDRDPEPTEGGEGSVLWAARTVEPGAAERTDEAIARRRRHARLLSWAGALVLVAGAALWLVPDRSGDDDGDQELPAVDVTSTTRSRTQILDQAVTTATTATTATTTPPTSAPPTTTRRNTTTTARRAPATTTPPTSPPATGSPTTTLGLPGNPGTVNPNRTVPTTAAPTPTTTTTPASTDGGTDTGGPTDGV